jgi:hypothetical protein
MPLTINDLVPKVQNRLEEDTNTTAFPDGTFWSIQFEIRTAIAEACNDLMLLVGRPTQTVNQTVALAVGSVWNALPAGVFALTDIYGASGQLRRATLFDMDMVQSSWGPDWESDTSVTGPLRWGPLGFSGFFVHPAPSVPLNVTVTAVRYPIVVPWPYGGSEQISFQNEMAAALEMYAAHYARIKEGSQDFQSSLQLYKDYIAMAKRLTAIEDVRDSVIFSPGFGGQAGTNGLTQR